ncbi:methyltransferase domain-containing protein [Streptomyces tsukubensis]|uniref:methyltransferase domain-containing protein n=1 Tax=Streptomyces tsukubensis TaxID=83656 RepID=UPI00098EBC4F|nr:methyltransferase domain-containing protein [Streptomyces tsukubensis]QFR94808.1 methyltransferase [Streptomyces tsukubensis]
MEWQAHARRLATEISDPVSRWLAPVARVPRHELVPRWWERDGGAWVLRDGACADPDTWAEVAYADTSLVTRVGAFHADHAQPGDRPTGLPTSCGTLPGLVVRMLRLARLGDGLPVLDLGTGTGLLAAYASFRVGAQHVTSLDVDPYLVSAAGDRLAGLGHHPKMVTADATDHVPGTYERIVSTVGLPPGPGLRAVLAALPPGGRLVTPLARTSLIVTGWKRSNGDVVGRVEWEWARFMPARSGDDYPPGRDGLLDLARNAGGDGGAGPDEVETSTGRYPVVDVVNAWELRSMLEVTTPGVELDYVARGRGRTACLAHPDGSWARASAEWCDPPTVHQGGPRRLWDALERIRSYLNTEGSLPLYGAHVRITPDGTVHLSRGLWRASMGGSFLDGVSNGGPSVGGSSLRD